MTKSMAFPCFVRGDLIEYRTGFHGSWRPGVVEATERHRVTVSDGYSGRRHAIDLGKRGKVRALHGPKLPADVQGVRAAERARILPSLPPVLVRMDGLPVAVPTRRKRYRSEAYKAFVRGWPCCNPECCAPAPSDPHHSGDERGVGYKADDYSCVPCCRRCHDVVTDTYALPGCSREETEAIFQAERERLLVEWAARSEGLRAA